jgi:hypothetical protein
MRLLQMNVSGELLARFVEVLVVNPGDKTAPGAL